jgi:RNA polymerase sigma-70 factor (ECF subfamily)
VSAWRNLGEFGQRSSLRTWLYQIATNRCLSMLRADSRRPRIAAPRPEAALPEPTGAGDAPPWLEPYPDVLLDHLADQRPGPEARYETTEAISLAFITALQLLPPRQRAALILRDVLGFHASEAARILDTSEESVTSALKRARATLERHQRSAAPREAPPPPGSAAEQHLVDQLTRAFETANVGRIVALLAEDVWVTMPPLPLEYQGRELAVQFLRATAFRPGWTARLISTRANGQPAFGFYARNPQTGTFYTVGLLVLTLSGTQISAMTRFDPATLPRFGLPATLAR